MNRTWKTGLAALALASLPLVSACSDAGSDENPEVGTKDDGTTTLAAALGNNDNLRIVRDAMEESELSGVLDGPASYTLLAPNDDALDKMGKSGEALLDDEQRPLLVALIRDHLLPGHLTPEAIGEAIDRKGGPVTMTTLGNTEVTFSKSGSTMNVSLADGGEANFSGAATATNNGVVIPIDAVLLPPKG